MHLFDCGRDVVGVDFERNNTHGRAICQFLQPATNKAHVLFARRSRHQVENESKQFTT
jgi:hypothetical protein